MLLKNSGENPVQYCTNHIMSGFSLEKTNERRNGSDTVQHGIRGSVNNLARHGLKRCAGTVLRSTGSQSKLKRYRAKGCACIYTAYTFGIQHIYIIFGLFLCRKRPNLSL